MTNDQSGQPPGYSAATEARLHALHIAVAYLLAVTHRHAPEHLAAQLEWHSQVARRAADQQADGLPPWPIPDPHLVQAALASLSRTALALAALPQTHPPPP